jgi:hypothetical protein
MKLILSGMILASLILSCSNSADTTKVEDTTGVNRPGVENVNGNIPETTNSIPLETHDTIVPLPVDSINK